MQSTFPDGWAHTTIHALKNWVDSHAVDGCEIHCAPPEKPNRMIGFPNVNTNKAYGFNRGFISWRETRGLGFTSGNPTFRGFRNGGAGFTPGFFASPLSADQHLMVSFPQVSFPGAKWGGIDGGSPMVCWYFFLGNPIIRTGFQFELRDTRRLRARPSTFPSLRRRGPRPFERRTWPASAGRRSTAARRGAGTSAWRCWRR